jgi:hypothetical protein
MHTFTLSVPFQHPGNEIVTDFGVIIELARERAYVLGCVVYILMAAAAPGCPNRWAVSPKGYLSVEGVQLPVCLGCGG